MKPKFEAANDNPQEKTAEQEGGFNDEPGRLGESVRESVLKGGAIEAFMGQLGVSEDFRFLYSRAVEKDISSVVVKEAQMKYRNQTLEEIIELTRKDSDLFPEYETKPELVLAVTGLLTEKYADKYNI